MELRTEVLNVRVLKMHRRGVWRAVSGIVEESRTALGVSMYTVGGTL
jgi:hypothetical protein